MKGSDERNGTQQRGMTMASDPPTDAPRTGDPMAPPSESPRSIATNHRRKPQPHHRPSSSGMQITYGDRNDPTAEVAIQRWLLSLLRGPGKGVP